MELEDPLAALLQAIERPSPSDSAPARTLRLQVLVFMLERHWAILRPHDRETILATLRQVARQAAAPSSTMAQSSHADDLTLAWKMIALAALAEVASEGSEDEETTTRTRRSGSKGSKMSLDDDDADDEDERDASSTWEAAWQLCSRRMTHAPTARAACHLADVLLSRSLVSEQSFSRTATVLMRELEFAAPPGPSDAVCRLLARFVGLAQKDMRLARLDFPGKVLAWLNAGWAPSSLSVTPSAGLVGGGGVVTGTGAARVDPISALALVRLLCQATDIRRHLGDGEEQGYLSHCAAVSHAIEEAHTRPVSDFVLRAVVIEDHGPVATAAAAAAPVPLPTASQSQGSSIGADLAPAEQQHARALHFLDRCITLARQDCLDAGETLVSTVPLSKARRMITLVVVALLYAGELALNGFMPQPDKTRGAFELLARLLPVIAGRKWSPSERVQLLVALAPLFDDTGGHDTVAFPSICRPGSASSLPQRLQAKPASGATSAEPSRKLLAYVWAQAKDQMRDDLDVTFSAILRNASTPATSFSQPAASQGQRTPSRDRDLDVDMDDVDDVDADDFGRTVDASADTLLADYTLDDVTRFALCVRALATLQLFEGNPHATKKGVLPRLSKIVSLVAEDEGTYGGLLVAQQLFSAVSSKLVRLSASDVTTLCRHLGMHLSKNYLYQRSVLAATVAMHFLECTVERWATRHPDKGDVDFASHMLELCQYFAQRATPDKAARESGAAPQWPVRLRFIKLIDAYLAADPSQTSWGNDDESAASCPTSLLPTLLADEDTRVRFRAATSVCRHFDVLNDEGAESTSLYGDICKHSNADMARSFERTLTRILCFANVMVASGARRRASYSMLLLISSQVAWYVPHVRNAVSSVSHQLGLGSRAQLYLAYAGSLAFRGIQVSHEQRSYSDCEADRKAFPGKIRQHALSRQRLWLPEPPRACRSRLRGHGWSLARSLLRRHFQDQLQGSWHLDCRRRAAQLCECRRSYHTRGASESRGQVDRREAGAPRQDGRR